MLDKTINYDGKNFHFTPEDNAMLEITYPDAKKVEYYFSSDLAAKYRLLEAILNNNYSKIPEEYKKQVLSVIQKYESSKEVFSGAVGVALFIRNNDKLLAEFYKNGNNVACKAHSSQHNKFSGTDNTLATLLIPDKVSELPLSKPLVAKELHSFFSVAKNYEFNKISDFYTALNSFKSRLYDTNYYDEFINWILQHVESLIVYEIFRNPNCRKFYGEIINEAIRAADKLVDTLGTGLANAEQLFGGKII